VSLILAFSKSGVGKNTNTGEKKLNGMRFCYLILFGLFFSCAEKELIRIPDPYLESFWDKNVKSVKQVACVDSMMNQTEPYLQAFEFDESGNIILIQDTLSEEHRIFDRNHRLVVVERDNEILFKEEYKYVYDKEMNALIRRSFSPALDTKKENVLDSTIFKESIFLLNDRAQIVKEIDSEKNVKVEFFYE
jgi:hypothetical protein